MSTIPAFGLRTYAAEDIERYFSGVALEFEPRIKFEAIKAAKKSRFWSVFKSCRGIEHTIAVVAVLSFAASIFALTSPVFLEIALDTVIPQYDLDLLTVIAIGMALFTVFEAAVPMAARRRDVAVRRPCSRSSLPATSSATPSGCRSNSSSCATPAIS